MPISADNAKVHEYLKRRAPYSVVDTGLVYAAEGHVTECSKSGSRVQGIVRDRDGTNLSVSLDVVSPAQIAATCDCCSPEDLEEQWCAHAVALLTRAADLQFFSAAGGFASSESTYRMNTSSPAEIAAVIRGVGNTDPIPLERAAYTPQVEILLDLGGDRLGVKVLFDGEPQGPSIFTAFERASERALDGILLQILEDEGHWDELQGIWYINSSKGIELALGVVQEYDQVLSLRGGDAIVFAGTFLDARMTIEWLDSSAELVMWWLLPDGSSRTKEADLLGTGPYWTALDSAIYKISPKAARIASIFPYSSRITVSRSQMGPILEALRETGLQGDSVIVRNPECQPACEVKAPLPVLELAQRETPVEHFASSQVIEIAGYLDFEYPTPPANENVVYLPDRERERECDELLKSLGFQYLQEKKMYLLSGDAALDLLSGGSKCMPTHWRVTGLGAVKKSIRFAELTLHIGLSAPAELVRDKKGFGIDWFDCHISLIQNNANVPLSTLFKNVRSDTDRWVRLDSGAFARVPGGGLAQLKTTLGMLDPNYKLSNAIKTRVSAAQAVNFSRLEDERFSIKSDQHLKALSRKLQNFENISPVNVSKHFVGKLRPYQKEGLSWLNFLSEYGLDGILADEMGLGKTVQTLAFLQRLKRTTVAHRKLDKPALIVAPTSVITNWLYEARRFTPDLKVALLHGPQRRAHFGQLDQFDLVITSYALLRLDRYDLERTQWSYVILDEAQNIKNPQAATTKAAKALKARRRLALTGTPTENRPMELWSILDFLMPGYLGTHDFFKQYVDKPIVEQGPGVQAAKFLNAKTKPFILRRIKADVEKELPDKIESVLYVPMAASQRQIYMSILEEVRPRVFDEVAKKGISGATVSILAALLRLRQVCNHPNSIDALRNLAGCESGKFNLLKELVSEAIEAKRKILLFSQFRAMLAIICSWLDSQRYSYLYLDGTTKNRQDLVDRFNQDSNEQLFVISLRAGGTGLNLTAADTVIIYDPWWNPAVEVQAVDRAHRIGQTKKVNVYRLVTEQSIEQKIMELKRKKARIVDALVNSNGLTGLNLTKADLESFFSTLLPEEAASDGEGA